MKLVPKLCVGFMALAALAFSANGLATNKQIDQKHPAHIQKARVTQGATGTMKTQGTKKTSGTKGARSLGDISDEQQVKVQKTMSVESNSDATISKVMKEDSKTSKSIVQDMKH